MEAAGGHGSARVRERRRFAKWQQQARGAPTGGSVARRQPRHNILHFLR